MPLVVKPEDVVCIAGFAIEDSVRLRIVFESKSTAEQPLSFIMDDTCVVNEEISLTPQNRSQQIVEGMHELLQRASEKISLSDIDALTVVCIGTIEDQHKLIGVSISSPESKWEEDNKLPVFVDFLETVNNAVGDRRKNKFEVGKDFLAATDAKAGAEAMLFLQDVGNDFVYIPVKAGVNAGIIIYGQPVIRAQHPEFGHFYPPLHEIDAAVGFHGTCKHHGSCLEGFLSLSALNERRKYISGWSDLSDKAILASAIWEQIASHYLAHLIYNVTLAFAPSHIVVSRDLITQNVLDIAVQKFHALRGGHPNFATISKQDYVLLAKSLKASDEMVGALSLAWLAAINSVLLPRATGDLNGPVPAPPNRERPENAEQQHIPSSQLNSNIYNFVQYRERVKATHQALEDE